MLRVSRLGVAGRQSVRYLGGENPRALYRAPQGKKLSRVDRHGGAHLVGSDFVAGTDIDVAIELICGGYGCDECLCNQTRKYSFPIIKSGMEDEVDKFTRGLYGWLKRGMDPIQPFKDFCDWLGREILPKQKPQPVIQ